MRTGERPLCGSARRLRALGSPTGGQDRSSARALNFIEMFTRFVIHSNDIDSGRRQGLFQALGELETQGLLLEHEVERYYELRDWFRKNLRKPVSFTRSSKPHAKKVALSWFKDTATQHIGMMRGLVRVLEAHDVMVEILRSDRPGYVVYEDEFQVAAEPFNETLT